MRAKPLARSGFNTPGRREQGKAWVVPPSGSGAGRQTSPRLTMRAKWSGILLGGLALAGLQYPLWFADDGLLGLVRVQREVAAQEQDNAALRERNRRLAAEVEDLREGDEEIERLARSELGMVGPGEKMYLLVEEESDNQARSGPETPADSRD